MWLSGRVHASVCVGVRVCQCDYVVFVHARGVQRGEGDSERGEGGGRCTSASKSSRVLGGYPKGPGKSRGVEWQGAAKRELKGDRGLRTNERDVPGCCTASSQNPLSLPTYLFGPGNTESSLLLP